jgi:hypothetical protein
MRISIVVILTFLQKCYSFISLNSNIDLTSQVRILGDRIDMYISQHEIIKMDTLRTDFYMPKRNMQLGLGLSLNNEFNVFMVNLSENIFSF